MGRIIVTDTKTARVPYEMKESGHLLYTYEELCYYIKSRMPLWMIEVKRQGLTEWIRKTGVDVQDMDEASPEEAAEIILSAGNYMQETEISQILAQMEEYKDESAVKKEKELGDLYLLYHRTRKAVLAYQNAIYGMTGEEEDSFRASLYHNHGVALAGFFYWKEARVSLLRAVSISDSDESQKALDFVERMLKEHPVEEKWKNKKHPLDMKAFAEKKTEFLEELK